MKQRTITIVVAVMLFIGMLPCISTAEVLEESVVFFNGDTNSPIDELGDAESLYSKVVFTAPNTETVNIVTALYDENGVLTQSPAYDSVEATQGVVAEKTTTAVSVSGVSMVKVFIWGSGADPVMKKLAVIGRGDGWENDFEEKFVSSYGTSDNPFVIVQDNEMSVGGLLTACENTYIANEYVSVTAASQDVGTASAVYTPSIDDWANGTVAFSGEGLLKMTVSDYSFCEPTSFYVRVIAPQDTYAVTFENTDDYVYRVGNKNSVKLGSLFYELDNTYGTKNTAVTVETLYGNAEGVYTKNESDWTQGTIAFSGTGAVKVTVCDDYSNSVSLALEVVDAQNVTSYSELKNANCVLLNDITMSSGSSFYLSGATLYGNGFTFDVSDGAYTGTTMSENYLIYLADATLDNIEVVGAVYTEYGATVKSDYNRATIYSNGNNVIVNSYISNCSSPVRVNGGNLLVKNSTLKGGNFANMDIRNGNVTLEDVTTINQVGLNDTAESGTEVVGLGIVVYYENVLEATTVSVKGTLKQYNHLQKSDASYIPDSSAQELVIDMFDQTNLVYTDGNGTEWVNTGILSMTTAVGDDNITDVDGYLDAAPVYMGVTGYVHSPSPAAPETSYEYVSGGQYEIAPTYSFDYDKTYLEKTDGSNDYCVYDSGKISISFDEGETFSWDTQILTATKAGKTLDYTVSMNGTDYTGESIVFDTEGDYTVVYTYTDSYNYKPDSENNVATYDKVYTKEVYITVAEVAPDAKHAEFTFGSSGASSEKITYDSKTYVSASGVTADNTSWSYMTMGENKIYYPIIDVKFEDGSGKFWAYFPVFENAVTITDYADSGTGDEIKYNSGTTTKPSGLSAVKGVYKAKVDVTNWYNLTDSTLTQSGASIIFKYASSSSAPTDPVTYDSVLCYKSPEMSADREAYITLVQYSYTDEAGTTYYYYIGYNMAAHDNPDLCVTPDTLITLADGSKKEVQDLTGEEKLLVWNHETGDFDTAPVAYIVNHNGEEYECEVISLSFDDGKEIEIIGEHVFFDRTENKYVTLNSDAESYIGHEFAVMTDNSLTSSKLVDVKKEIRMTGVYEVVSYQNITCFTNDVLSASGYTEKLLNLFEINPETLGYDMKKVYEDIESYGLYTYEDFKDLVPENVFNMYNAKYLKVAVGKGYITWNDILALVEFYHSLDIVPLQ